MYDLLNIYLLLMRFNPHDTVTILQVKIYPVVRKMLRKHLNYRCGLACLVNLGFEYFNPNKHVLICHFYNGPAEHWIIQVADHYVGKVSARDFEAVLQIAIYCGTVLPC